MQQQTKERIQYGSAMVVLAFAIALVYISYFVSKDVTDNVLWYFGQSLMYVASILAYQSQWMSNSIKSKNNKSQ